jgi:glycerophosphoryl diester phosphodiesterase
MELGPLLLGHRGMRSRSHSVRENTFPAFDLALAHGCQGFEFDVRLTGDGQAVVCHDSKLKGIAIAKTAASRLAGLPLLEDVLVRYRGRAFLDIELKVPGLAPHLLSLLSQHPPECGYVVSSFLPTTVIELSRQRKSVVLGIICEKPRQLERWRELPVEYLIAHQSLITPGLVRDVHARRKNLFAWTVNNRKSMVRLARWGVDGIISDRTELLIETLTDRAVGRSKADSSGQNPGSDVRR